MRGEEMLDASRRVWALVSFSSTCCGHLRCAQWNESMSKGPPRISRPRQMFVGLAEPREYVPPEDRGITDPCRLRASLDGDSFDGWPQGFGRSVGSLNDVKCAQIRP